VRGLQVGRVQPLQQPRGELERAQHGGSGGWAGARAVRQRRHAATAADAAVRLLLLTFVEVVAWRRGCWRVAACGAARWEAPDFWCTHALLLLEGRSGILCAAGVLLGRPCPRPTPLNAAF
jgi:hypothetical protein